MRKVARYAFDVAAGNLTSSDTLWSEVQDLIHRWLASKGQRNETPAGVAMAYPDGRTALLQSNSSDLDDKAFRSWLLEEPSGSGTFATKIEVARSKAVIAVACELTAGAGEQVIAPVSFDARCPKVLREMRGVELLTTPMRFDSDEGGQELAALIESNQRSLPLVAVSEWNGLILHPNIAGEIAYDLSGLGMVAVATNSAAWGLTRELGAEWSCYNGAIRLYWPLHAVPRTPYQHPLWTSRRLLFGVLDSKQAAQRIRNQVRRKILGLSTLAMRPHAVFEEIAQGSRAKLMAERREQTTGKEWVEFRETEIGELEAAKKELSERVSGLETDLANAQAMLQWAPQETDDEVTPDADVPPETCAEAVERASLRLGESLVFGDDVTSGVNGLAADAGPPDKVLAYLTGLAQLAIARREGPLGASMVQWLTERKYKASGESDTIKNNQVEMQKRTWHDGSTPRKFLLHLKPTEATSPDRCVRIYFDWDDSTKKIIVGWVGRHP